jgi:hypothetical protein
MATYRLPEGFPHELSDDDLVESVESLMVALRDTYGDGVGKWLPELQIGLLTMALSEQSHRQLAGGSRLAFVSLLVGGLALAVAVITLFAT